MRLISVSTAALAAIFAVFFGLPVWGHHSHGNYDVTKWTIMEGTVKEVHLLVPHSWIYLEVKDDKGQPTTWALEATGPGGLVRVGIKREDVRPGDAVKVRCHLDRKSTRLNSSHDQISYAVFCLKKKKQRRTYVRDSRPTL